MIARTLEDSRGPDALKTQMNDAGLCAAACRCLYSGSWDYSVRIWSRTRLRTLSVLSCADWVWGVCPRASPPAGAGRVAILLRLLNLSRMMLMSKSVSCPRIGQTWMRCMKAGACEARSRGADAAFA